MRKDRMSRPLIRLAGLLLLLALSGCSYSGGKLLDADQPSWEEGSEILLTPDVSVGQTFVAQHKGLAGIEFVLAADPGTSPALTLHLRSDPRGTSDLASASLQLTGGEVPRSYRFSFPAQGDSHGRYYYAFLEAEPGARMAAAGGDAYLNGAAYANHMPLDQQLAFGLVYYPGHILLDLIGAGVSGLGLLLAAGLLFIVPGWALLNGLYRGQVLGWAAKLGLAAGISLALYPVLLLWTDLVGLHLGALYAWLPPGLGLAALAWQGRPWRLRCGWQRLQHWARSEVAGPDLALLLLMGIVMAIRLVVVRSLDAPMWGDSYQHTLIVQLLADNGGLFQSWEPYASLDQFSYHFGFHSAAAVLHWLTQLPAIQATLWTGQLLNGLAVLALYPLALRVTGSRWAGVWAVLLAGMLSPLPMGMVNWGRYTQLAGMVILPAAAWLTWEVVDSDERRWGLPVLLGLVVSGLALTHYRVSLFYIAFVPGLVVVYWDCARHTRLLPLAASATAATLLFVPWFVNAFGSEILRMFGAQLTTLPDRAGAFLQEYNAIGRLDSYLAPLWWLALTLGVGFGLWQRRKPVLVVALWWFLLLIMTNPGWLGLPGTGAISNFALFITAYLPASLFTGVLAAYPASYLQGKGWGTPVTVLVILVLGLWGIPERMRDLDARQHALVTRPDVQAAVWIQENTATDARFLINSFFAYADSAVVGSDGGWWLPVLAGRQVSVPPLNYANELFPGSAYRQRVAELGRVVQGDLDDPAAVDLLRHEGITHVYVGQRQGRVNYGGESVLLPAELLQSEHYALVYHLDRVWILAVKP
jgi:hypothetical protein